MPFCPKDFEQHHERLRIIAYSKLHLNYFQAFSELSKRNQKLVNQEINNFIKLLPEENYENIIIDLFQNICNDEIFDENFHKTAASMVVRKSTKQEIEQDDEATQQGIEMHKKTIEMMNNIKPLNE